MPGRRSAYAAPVPGAASHRECAGAYGRRKNPAAGEISLAHKGVLFLDELPEFARETVEALRQPLEEGAVHLVRLGGSYVYPADFMLVAAMNPCPCGYYPDMQKCRCTQTAIHRYLERISQPILDRIDICVEAPALTFGELTGQQKEETSAANSEARGGGTGHSTGALPEGRIFVQQPDTCHEDPGVLCS